MEKEIILKGLSASPSDYAVEDGHIAGCVSLVPEDGSLKPIKDVTQLFSVPEGAKVYIHQTPDYTHYIIVVGTSYSWRYLSSSGTYIDGGALSDLAGFSANSIVSMGNIVCFVGSEKILYEIWKDDKYYLFDMSNLSYKISIPKWDIIDTTRFLKQINTGNMGSSFFSGFELYYGTQGDKLVSAENYDTCSPTAVYVTSDGMKSIFANLDAIVNKFINNGDAEFAYKTFGVAALRLYDGTYVLISNIFVLGDQGSFGTIFCHRNESTEENHCVETKCVMYNAYIQIDMNLGDVSDLIQGVDIFLSKGTTFYELNEKTMCTLYRFGTGMYESWKFDYKIEDTSKMYDDIDGLSFYHSIFIEKTEFGAPKKLKHISETNEALTLSDFSRSNFGAGLGYIYNNRLHIGDVKTTPFSLFNYSFYPSFRKYNSYDLTNSDVLKYNYQILDLTTSQTNGIVTDSIFVVYINNNGKTRKVYFSGNYIYPIPPFVMFPDANANKMDIYMHENSLGYIKATIPLHMSYTKGMSYYIGMGYWFENADRSNPDSGYLWSDWGCLQRKGQKDIITNSAKTDYGVFSTCEESEYNAALASANGKQDSIASHNLIKVSDADSPITFPASYSITAGNGAVRGMATAVRAFSSGQYGEYPLYIFATDGIWAAKVSDTGTYSSVKPGPRDVVENIDSITQIDDTVLYASSRGIMMLDGYKSDCISELLDGPMHWTSLPHISDVLATVGLVPFTLVSFRTFLSGCSMIYDYYNQRIVVYNSEYGYAYVYSLKSKLWGMMPSSFVGEVNSYPGDYVLVSENGSTYVADMVNTSVNSSANNNSIPVFFVTRPQKFDEQDVFKSISSLSIRGYFDRTHLGCALWGSNDLIRWFLVWTGKYNFLRGFGGSSYKYYCIGAVAKLDDTESIHKLSVIFDNKLNNKLR